MSDRLCRGRKPPHEILYFALGMMTLGFLRCATTQGPAARPAPAGTQASHANSQIPPQENGTDSLRARPTAPVPVAPPPLEWTTQGHWMLGDRKLWISKEHRPLMAWLWQTKDQTWRVCNDMKAILGFSSGGWTLEEREVLQHWSQEPCRIRDRVLAKEKGQRPYLLQQLKTMTPRQLKEVALCQTYAGPLGVEAGWELVAWIKKTTNTKQLQTLKKTAVPRCLGSMGPYVVAYEEMKIDGRIDERIQKLAAKKR